MNSYPTRWTKQMKVVVDIVYDEKGPITADHVYEKARDVLPRISLGTVYRNLNRLVQSGIISESKVGPQQCFFPHPYSNTYLECKRCGSLTKVDYEIHLGQVSKATGLMIDSYEIRFKGLCKECEPKCI